jgi:hypothetical protein
MCRILTRTIRKDIEMAKTHLLQAVCAVALLAAGPALAQRPEAGMTNAAGQPNPMVHQNDTAANTAPTGQTGSSSSSTAGSSHYTHRSAMGRSMHGRSDMSQDAAVDRLNDQSYQAAQQGQALSGNGSGMSTAPSPSGTMPSAAAPGGSSSGSK